MAVAAGCKRKNCLFIKGGRIIWLSGCIYVYIYINFIVFVIKLQMKLSGIKKYTISFTNLNILLYN